MKPAELKQEYIRLRAEGRSYSYISQQLHISKSTCTAWEKELGVDIAQLKKEELNTLYECFHMKKEARIKQLGGTLEKIEEAIQSTDFSEIPPEKLLELNLKYKEALHKEYTGTTESIDFNSLAPKDIITALSDLLNRVRSGEVSTEQANKESAILSNLLKAYETAEVKEKLDQLEALLRGNG